MSSEVPGLGRRLTEVGSAQPLVAGAVQSVVRYLTNYGMTGACRGLALAVMLGGLTTEELGAEVADAPAAESAEVDSAVPAAEGRTADRGDNPYRAIVVRNAFGLKEPVPPPEPPPPAPPVPETPKLDVKIAGVGEIAGVRYAYLMVPDTDRPGQFLYPALTDDPQRGRVRHSSGIEIREIDLKAQSVRLVNGGIETTLSLLENGVGAAPGASGAGAKTTAIPAPGRAPTRPALTRGAKAVPTPASAGNAGTSAEPLVFSRNRNRANAANNSFTPNNSTASGSGVVPLPATSAASVLAGGANLPSRPLRTTPDSSSSGSAAPAPAIPLAEQYQILVRQRQAADAAGIPLPPIPGLPMPTDPQPLVPAQ